MERRLRLSRFLLDPARAEEREEFAASCRDDPAFFFRNCVWTQDPERNIGDLVEIPLITYSYQVEPIPYRGSLAGGWLKRWHSALVDHVPGKKTRLLEEKTRRTLLSISMAGFLVWGLRFFPGFHAWVSSASQDAIDHGEDWDAIFGKVRYIWNHAQKYYPWLYPELPPVGKGSLNKDCYIEFPAWKVGDREVARASWGNKIRGLTPNEVSGRGGGALFGFIDEAGWIPGLDAFLDNIEQMTSFLILGSTPPADSEHPFAKRAQGEFGYEVSAVHWTMNPMMAGGIYWDEDADFRGPHTQKWRSTYYDEILKTQPTHVVARNYDLDYRSVAGDRIFVGFTPGRARATTEAAGSADADLYDPSWPLEIWYDVGRRDPWASLWVQVSDATGEVRIVDYWMRSGVSVEWWLPLWLGWDVDQIDRWRTYPDMRPWKDTVPWGYGEADRELIRRWHARFGRMPHTGEEAPWGSVRPRRFVQDAYGLAHGSAGPDSVEDVMRRYKLHVVSSATTHNLEKWIEHANGILVRTRISPNIADRKPYSGGTAYPSITDSLLSWRWLPPTPRESRPKPAHDIHSHGCTAFIYGAMQLPAAAPALRLLQTGKLKRRSCVLTTPISEQGWAARPAAQGGATWL